MPTTTVNDAETRERLTGPAVKAFFRLAGLWELTEAQQLSLLGESLSRSTLHNWEAHRPSTLSVDQLMRISLLLAIYEGLQRFFRRSPVEADRWIHRPIAESPLVGATPLDFALTGGIPALVALRQYIEGAAGGAPSREWYPPLSREGE